MVQQVAAQRAAADRQHDVVDLRVVRHGNGLDLVERDETPAKPRSPVMATLSGVLGANPGPGRRRGRLVVAATPQTGQRPDDVGQRAHELQVLRGVVFHRRCRQRAQAGVLAAAHLAGSLGRNPVPRGVRSNRTRASMTAACPSSNAWWILV